MINLQLEVEKVVQTCEFIKYAELDSVINFAIEFVKHDKDTVAYPLIMEKLNERLDWDY